MVKLREPYTFVVDAKGKHKLDTLLWYEVQRLCHLHTLEAEQLLKEQEAAEELLRKLL